MDIGPRVASLGGGVRLGFPTIELGGEVSGYRRGGIGPRLSQSRPISSIRSSAGILHQFR